MEELIISKPEKQKSFSSDAQFIKANTEAVSFEHLLHDCIIPVFSKDNETTISHIDFIDTANEVAHHIFKGEAINLPTVRVSHPIKGRTPEAIRKPVNELMEYEKTIYYERMAFMIEIPSIRYNIMGNDLALVIGGVRAYNLENLFNRKTEERFKVFIGFQNKVCTNLCVSTDGYMAELKARTTTELGESIYELIMSFAFEKQLRMLEVMPNYFITEQQFANIIGRMRMYQVMPPTLRKEIPNLLISDTQINSVVKDYYFDKHFGRNDYGGIDIWSVYNLLTEANKSSYIDTFLDRSVNANQLCSHLMEALDKKSYSWYLS
jgi:hypothetical protein